MNRVTRLGAKRDTAAQRLSYKPFIHNRGDSIRTGLISLAPYGCAIFDQGHTGSCEGHRASQGLVTCFNYKADHAAEKPLGYTPSPLGIYRDARILERRPIRGVLPQLQDEGCATYDVIDALLTIGIRPIGTLVSSLGTDCTPQNVNDDPTITQLTIESKAGIKIDAYANDIDMSDLKVALSKMQTALMSGVPVALDVQVDTIFENWDGGNPLDDCDPNDPNGGGHAILCTEMFSKADGSVVLAGPNSWGDWGSESYDGTYKYGYWRATPNWLQKACFAATVWNATRA